MGYGTRSYEICLKPANGKTNLQQYEHAFAAGVQQAYPISAESHIVLRQLQHRLRLKDEDILSIEERSTTPIREFRQKSLRYRSLAERLIGQDMGSISPSTRSALDALRDELVLHVDETARIEDELLKPYRERNGDCNLQLRIAWYAWHRSNSGWVR